MDLNYVITVICGFSALVFLMQLLRPYLSFLKQGENILDSEEGVSVIISARNEGANISANLPLILAQEYSLFEVIVINDASWDDTALILADFQNRDSRLSVVTVTEEQKRTEGKKMALTLGIKKAKFNRFLLTDADCRPASEFWIKEMSSRMSKGIVLGYGGYTKESGFLNLLVRYDSWSSAAHFLGKAALDRPYVGVGRNLGYMRSIYDKVGGFRSHYHVISGDDDLFINQAATHSNTSICLPNNSFTTTASPKSFAQWIRKKTRHLSSSRLYSSATKKMLFMLYASQCLFYISLAIGLIVYQAFLPLGIVFLAKTLIHMLISIPAAKRLEATDVLVLLPMLEPVNLVVNSFATIKMKWSKKIPWN